MCKIERREFVRNREVYSKFVEHLNKEQPALLLDKEINSLRIYAEQTKSYRERR